MRLRRNYEPEDNGRDRAGSSGGSAGGDPIQLEVHRNIKHLVSIKRQLVILF